MAVAELSAQSPRLQSEIAVSGFSYEGVLGAPAEEVRSGLEFREPAPKQNAGLLKDVLGITAIVRIDLFWKCFSVSVMTVMEDL